MESVLSHSKDDLSHYVWAQLSSVICCKKPPPLMRGEFWHLVAQSTYLIEAGTAKATQWNTVLPPWVWTQCGIISMGLCLRGAQPSVFCPPALPVQGLVQAELHRSGLHLLAWKYIRSGLFCKQIYSFTARLPVTALIRDTVSQSVEVCLRLH